jgi:DNA primase
VEDRYRTLRELPFDVVAGALGIDVSRFKLRKGGTELSGPCPVHGGKRSATAFSYSQDGKWHCFSCGEKGKGAIDLSMKIRRIGFQQAVDLLQPYAGNAVVEGLKAQARKPEIRMAQEIPKENEAKKFTYEKFKVDSAWLKERGLRPETLERYGVFEYRNDKRQSAYNGSVLIRIQRYSDGETVGYLSRNIGEITHEKPKYRIPEGLHKSLEVWGAWQLKGQSPIRVLYVVESAFSAMHFHQLGFPAVALLGWSVSDQQLQILCELARGVVYLPDSDKRKEAGSCASLIASKLWCRFPEMPVADPEQFTADQIRNLT